MYKTIRVHVKKLHTSFYMGNVSHSFAFNAVGMAFTEATNRMWRELHAVVWTMSGYVHSTTG